MLDMVLRVYGEQFDVEQFVNQYQDLLILDSFKKGEDDMLGNPSEFSGFDVMIAENETKGSCLQKIQQFLDVHQLALSFLKANAVNCVLDIDATVKVTDEMPTSVNLSPQLMGELHNLNIAIEFSAYPHIEGL
ncbi:MAG: hypothetical protein HRT93_11130 [Piscirickettsiaceae bacterium]|jgi:hypothetical protein|nr:hypothetical protein [Piscirickettsiaceae bacterium]